MAISALRELGIIEFTDLSSGNDIGRFARIAGRVKKTPGAFDDQLGDVIIKDGKVVGFNPEGNFDNDIIPLNGDQAAQALAETKALNELARTDQNPKTLEDLRKNPSGLKAIADAVAKQKIEEIKAGFEQHTSKPEPYVPKVSGDGYVKANGTIHVNYGIPVEPADELDHAFKCYINDVGSVVVMPGRCYWWNQSSQEYQETELEGTLGSSGYVLVRLEVNTSTGSGSWSLEISATNKVLTDTDYNTRFWCIAYVENGLIDQRISSDIYETRAS